MRMIFVQALFGLLKCIVYTPLLTHEIFYFCYCQVSLTQARIDMSELDEDSDGFLQPHVLLLCFYSSKFLYLVWNFLFLVQK